MRLQPYQFKKAKIEVVPLIDVVFFLLATFVMVSLSMTRSQGMQVQLPSAATAAQEPQQEEAALAITVMENGELYCDKEKIAAGQLPFKLQTYKATAKDPRVVVNAASDADFKLVVAVLDAARQQGITKVGISTRKL